MYLKTKNRYTMRNLRLKGSKNPLHRPNCTDGLYRLIIVTASTCLPLKSVRRGFTVGTSLNLARSCATVFNISVRNPSCQTWRSLKHIKMYFVHPGIVHEVPSWSGCIRAANHLLTMDQKSLPFSWDTTISALGRLHFLPQWDTVDIALDGREPSSVSAGKSGWMLVPQLPLPVSACSSWLLSWSSSATLSKIWGCSIAKWCYMLTFSISIAGWARGRTNKTTWMTKGGPGVTQEVVNQLERLITKLSSVDILEPMTLLRSLNSVSICEI